MDSTPLLLMIVIEIGSIFAGIIHVLPLQPSIYKKISNNTIIINLKLV
jgi:hypothetical protein